MKNNLKLLSHIVPALFALVLGLGGCDGSTETSPEFRSKQKIKFQASVRFPIPIVESGQASFYLAEDLGFFQKESLKIKFEMGSRELNPIKAAG